MCSSRRGGTCTGWTRCDEGGASWSPDVTALSYGGDMSTHWEWTVGHAFVGDRFNGDGLDIRSLPDLVAYRDLVMAVAEHVFRKEHAGRVRLLRGFHEKYQLRCASFREGSCVVSIERSVPAAQLEAQGDPITRAIALVEEAVEAANQQQRLPRGFPRAALPKFRKWGRTLAEGERIELRERNGASRATYTLDTRASLISRIAITREDAFEMSGHVLASSVRRGTFELYSDMSSADGVSIPMALEHESLVLEAMADYSGVRIRVAGRAEFSSEGPPIRFTEVATLVREPTEVDNSSLWARIAAISASVPDEEWAKLPTDGSIRTDFYLQQ